MQHGPISLQSAVGGGIKCRPRLRNKYITRCSFQMCPSYLSSLFRDEKEGRGNNPCPPWGFSKESLEQLGGFLGLLKLCSDDHALRVIGERARLQGQYVPVLQGIHHVQVRRVHRQKFEDLVSVLFVVGVGDGYLFSHLDVVYVVEGEEAGRARVAEAVAGEVHVCFVLPREAGAYEVDTSVVPKRVLVLAERVGEGGLVYAIHAGNGDRQGLVCGAVVLLLLLGRRARRDRLFGRGLPLFRAAAGDQGSHHRQGRDHQQELPYAHVRHLFNRSTYRDRRPRRNILPFSHGHILYQRFYLFH